MSRISTRPGFQLRHNEMERKTQQKSWEKKFGAEFFFFFLQVLKYDDTKEMLNVLLTGKREGTMQE